GGAPGGGRRAAAEPGARGPPGRAATPGDSWRGAPTFARVGVPRVSTALAARGGGGSARSRQAEPRGEVHTAGELPAAPTATNPDRAAVTASSCPLVPGAVSEARAQVFRSAENHAAGPGLPPAPMPPRTPDPARP